MNDLTINIEWVIYKYKTGFCEYEWRAIKAPVESKWIGWCLGGWIEPYISAKTEGDLRLKLKQL